MDFGFFSGENCVSIILVMRVLVSVFFAVLFLQSGIDKIIDWNGNFSWLNGHFKNSVLNSFVPFMLGTITVFEVSSGLLSAFGAFALVFTQSPVFSVYGLLFSCISLLCLFFGQRMAKDYSGSAALVPYFMLALFGLYLFV